MCNVDEKTAKSYNNMGAYFIVKVKINKPESRLLYDEYIAKVKPIVESFGGEYLVRTENITSLSNDERPDRIIIIRFENRKQLDICFSSKEYCEIKNLRIDSVDANALIVEGI